MFTKMTIAFVVVLASVTGGLAASKTQRALQAPGAYEAYGLDNNMALYRLHEQIRRDTFTHD